MKYSIKRNLSILLFVVIAHFYCYSEQPIIDSLWREYNKSKSDTAKINLLINNIAVEYENFNADSAIICYNKALNIIHGLLKNITGNDSLKTNLLQFSGKANRFAGYVYYKTGNFAAALDKFSTALSIFEELNYIIGLSQSFNDIGIVYDDMDNYEKALEFYHKSLKLAERAGLKKIMSACYTNIGIVHRNQRSYGKALDYYFLSLKLARETASSLGAASCYANIGEVYHELKQLDKSQEYYEKALAISEELKDKFGISFCLMSMGNINLDRGNFKESFECYQK